MSCRWRGFADMAVKNAEYAASKALLDEWQRDLYGRDMRPGLFKIQLIERGPWIPAGICRPCPIEMPADEPWQWIDRWPSLRAWIDVDLFGRPKWVEDPFRVWINGKPVTFEDYLFSVDLRVHIMRNEPDAHDADPHKSVDINTMAPALPPEEE